MLFQKGVADSGLCGSKFFGRIMIQESQIGDGCLHKVWRAKVIYGLEPVFESGNTCIIKARNHVAYGGKGDGSLVDRNLEIAMQVWWLLLIIQCVLPASHLAEHLFTVFTGMCRSAKFRTWLVNIAKYLLQKQDWLKTSAPLLSKYRYFEVKDNSFSADGLSEFTISNLHRGNLCLTGWFHVTLCTDLQMPCLMPQWRQILLGFIRGTPCWITQARWKHAPAPMSNRNAVLCSTGFSCGLAAICYSLDSKVVVWFPTDCFRVWFAFLSWQLVEPLAGFGLLGTIIHEQ